MPAWKVAFIGLLACICLGLDGHDPSCHTEARGLWIGVLRHALRSLFSLFLKHAAAHGCKNPWVAVLSVGVRECSPSARPSQASDDVGSSDPAGALVVSSELPAGAFMHSSDSTRHIRDILHVVSGWARPAETAFDGVKPFSSMRAVPQRDK